MAILDSGAPVLVQMETLRRATIFARHDPYVAKELITRIQARAANLLLRRPAGLALFDLGYLAEAYKQWIRANPTPPRALTDTL